MIQRLLRILVLPAALSLPLIGCGPSYQVVPVAGKVTLDGQPVANVRVVFQPFSSKTGTEAGPGSAGITDEQGHYTLTTISVKPQPGAVVGSHTVQFDAVVMPKVGEEAAVATPKTPRIPPTTHSFDVPAGGTDQANFDLKSPELQRPMQPRS